MNLKTLASCFRQTLHCRRRRAVLPRCPSGARAPCRSVAISMTPWLAPSLPPIRHPPITAVISPLYQKESEGRAVANNAGKFARRNMHGKVACLPPPRRWSYGIRIRPQYPGFLTCSPFALILYRDLMHDCIEEESDSAICWPFFSNFFSSFIRHHASTIEIFSAAPCSVLEPRDTLNCFAAPPGNGPGVSGGLRAPELRRIYERAAAAAAAAAAGLFLLSQRRAD